MQFLYDNQLFSKKNPRVVDKREKKGYYNREQNKAMSKRMVDLAKIYFKRFDEKIARKASVLQRRIPPAVCNCAKYDEFRRYFPSKINQMMRQSQNKQGGKLCIVENVDKN